MIKKQTFREEIRERLENAILTNALKPGDRILETHWAKQLGVSQAPVREAIRDLEAMGLVETKPYCGSTVRGMTNKDIIDNFDVRCCLEQMAIRSSIDHLTDENIGDMQRELDEMTDAAKKNDLRLFVVHDELFHETFVRFPDNDTLVRVWKQCNIRDWTHMTALSSTISLEGMTEMHQKLFDAICTRDADIACEAIKKHLDDFADVMVHAQTKKK